MSEVFEFMFSQAIFNAMYPVGLALFIFLLVNAVVWLINRVLLRKSLPISGITLELLLLSIEKLSKVFIFISSVYATVHILDFPQSIEKRVWQIFLIAIAFQCAAILNSAVERILFEKFSEDVDGRAVQSPTGTVALAVSRFLLVSFLVLITLDNLGVNVSGLITGIGIGGVAIALAVQKILGDLFASLSIALDKPFKIGEFIVIDDSMGTIERVGLKTTRIRSLSGELLVFPNSILLETRIRNYSKMRQRRVVLRIGLTYDSSVAQINLARAEVCRLIEQTAGMRLERGNFSDFSAFSLDLEFVYWIESADYGEYMKLKEQLNLAIKEFFDRNGIGFAFPTQTIHAYVKPT
ncbi:MAG: hypothetical protein RLZZ488_2641 [Pseudomonadota bacterium]